MRALKRGVMVEQSPCVIVNFGHILPTLPTPGDKVLIQERKLYPRFGQVEDWGHSKYWKNQWNERSTYNPPIVKRDNFQISFPAPPSISWWPGGWVRDKCQFICRHCLLYLTSTREAISRSATISRLVCQEQPGCQHTESFLRLDREFEKMHQNEIMKSWQVKVEVLAEGI